MESGSALQFLVWRDGGGGGAFLRIYGALLLLLLLLLLGRINKKHGRAANDVSCSLIHGRVSCLLVTMRLAWHHGKMKRLEKLKKKK